MEHLKVPTSKHDWILNTPERKGILSEGAPKYASMNLIGRGAFGSVFKAIFRDHPVALKIVKLQNSFNSTVNEANILGWKHRNIVRILMIESTLKYCLIIMEHFQSRSLQQILDTIELPLAQRIFICLDILNGLSYCHSLNVLHLDIKPQNVLVAFKNIKSTKPKNTFLRNYICKLCDFGSSLKILNEQPAKVISPAGTIRYMSPEALCSQQLTTAADIFSFGILMWQTQQRRLPYDKIQCNEIVAFHVVKSDLRPNSLFKQFLLSSSAAASPCRQNTFCRCFKTETRSILQRSHVKRGCCSLRKEKSLTLSISPQPKIGAAIEILNSYNIRKVARNLSKDFDLDGITEITENGCAEEIALLRQVPFDWCKETLAFKETAFSSIYELCWQAKPALRPHIIALKSLLKSILKSNKTS